MFDLYHSITQACAIEPLFNLLYAPQAYAPICRALLANWWVGFFMGQVYYLFLITWPSLYCPLHAHSSCHLTRAKRKHQLSRIFARYAWAMYISNIADATSFANYARACLPVWHSGQAASCAVDAGALALTFSCQGSNCISDTAARGNFVNACMGASFEAHGVNTRCSAANHMIMAAGILSFHHRRN